MDSPPFIFKQKIFFLFLTLPKPPKKCNHSPKHMGESSPSPEAGMGLGGQASMDWLPFLCPFWHILPEVQVLRAKRPITARLVSFRDYPALRLHALAWKVSPSSVTAPASLLA